jgi:hypothetical protein
MKVCSTLGALPMWVESWEQWADGSDQEWQNVLWRRELVVPQAMFGLG